MSPTNRVGLALFLVLILTALTSPPTSTGPWILFIGMGIIAFLCLIASDRKPQPPANPADQLAKLGARSEPFD